MPDTTLFSNARASNARFSRARLSSVRFSRASAIALLLSLLTGCAHSQNPVAPRALQIQQDWQLQPGDEVVGHLVVAGLGDVSIDLNGSKVRAPFDGEVQPYQADCVIFSSPQVPAYLFRLCGVERPRWGEVEQGEAIGSAETLAFAALRRQQNGKWAMVEPSVSVLERTVRQP